MRKALDLLYDIAGYLAGFCVFLIFVVMVAASVLREFGVRTGGTDDIASWLCAAAAFLGLAHTFRHGDFVRVSLLIERFSPSVRHVFEIMALIIGTLFVGYIAWSVTAYVVESYQFNDMANGLIVIPRWIPQMSLVIGTILLLIAFIDELIHVARGNRPTYVVAVEERHARGDFSEDV